MKTNAPLRTQTRWTPSGMIAADLLRQRVRRAAGCRRRRCRLRWARRRKGKHNILARMKRFQMITEADARVLEYGSTVMLVTGGHITPLAQDTLKARRVSVVRESGDGDEAALAPRADIRTVAIGGDHTSRRAESGDRGASARTRPGGPRPRHRQQRAGRLSGYGRRRRACRSRAAKPTPGIVDRRRGPRLDDRREQDSRASARRCAPTETLARYAREHNGANVLALGSTLVSTPDALGNRRRPSSARRCAKPRYIRRLAKIRELERRRALMQPRRPAASHSDHRRGARGGERRPRRRAARAIRCCTSAARIGCAACSMPARHALGLHATGGAPGGVASMIDHTLLKPDATRKDIEALCREAARVQVRQRLREPDLGGARVRALLQGSGVEASARSSAFRWARRRPT